MRAERLPLHGEHAVALQVTEGAVVGDDLEAVAERFEAAAGPMAAVARARRRGRRARPPASSTSSSATASSVSVSDTPAASNSSAARRRSSSPSTCSRRTEGPSPVRLSPRRSRPRRAGPPSRGLLAAAQVVDPLSAPVGALDARDEARHHGLDGLEDLRPVGARLGERVGEQVQDKLLVGLTRGEDAHVRERGGREQPAEQVERLGRHRAGVGAPATPRAPAGTPAAAQARTTGSERAYTSKSSFIAAS